MTNPALLLYALYKHPFPVANIYVRDESYAIFDGVEYQHHLFTATKIINWLNEHRDKRKCPLPRKIVIHQILVAKLHRA
jgi:hypothetical protein